MKKSALIAMACAALMSASAYAQQAPEITYVEDPAQGYTFNRFKDNWFIGIEGGVNYQFSKYDHNRKWSDRFAPQASIYFGKWFSPIIGSRVSLGYVGMKGLTNDENGFGFVYKDKAPVMYKDKYYKTFVYNFGGSLDMMVNFTNWWCGYKPNRVYNFIAYAGGATYFGFKQGENKKYFDKSYDTTLALRVGFINSFNVSKQVALALDIRYMAAGANRDDVKEYNTINSNLGATLSLTYLFNNRTWTAPIVPVIPEIPTCDEYKAQLAEADAKINNLQKQLNDCLNRPVEKPAPCIAPLATVYFPIGSARLNRVDNNVLKSVAAEIKANPSTKYDVTGWADTWTGTDAINARLRTNRANAVVKQLVRNGVNEGQLNAKSGEGNRIDNRDQIYLDRAVTIEAVK